MTSCLSFEAEPKSDKEPDGPGSLQKGLHRMREMETSLSISFSIFLLPAMKNCVNYNNQTRVISVKGALFFFSWHVFNECSTSRSSTGLDGQTGFGEQPRRKPDLLAVNLA